ncbi:hypothetical protein XELAEV_18025393mg [Xenopus laevis]|uniref:Uncharacterized protein n=1 Tax=Xenopus laevis TaxID=8355 RepID=A0A974D0P3_XENLA|nr:hypothetical protein XELAEV_18025393mg [Xenopus laevis]
MIMLVQQYLYVISCVFIYDCWFLFEMLRRNSVFSLLFLSTCALHIREGTAAHSVPFCWQLLSTTVRKPWNYTQIWGQQISADFSSPFFFF